MNRVIDSPHNATIKYLYRLRVKSNVRRKEHRFLVEGVRETELALKGGYDLEEIFICPEIYVEKEHPLFKNIPKTEVSKEVYEKIAYRGNTQGVIGLVKAKELSLDNLRLKSKTPLILVAEFPEKPGNIGALLRTADAASVDAVLIANPKTDVYNPNVIRSSVGGVFTNQIATGNTSEIISFLKSKGIAIFSAILQESKPYTEIDFKQASAIVMGTEATGLSEEWRQASTSNIHIPMCGKIDSMNVSVSAGILMFEAKRQRGFKN